MVDTHLPQSDADKQRSVPSKERDPADIPEAKDYPARLDAAAFRAASEVGRSSSRHKIPQFSGPALIVGSPAGCGPQLDRAG